MAKKKKSRQSRPLVLGFLEQISSKVFSDFPKQLTDLVGHQHGVYALYKGSRLYYVGLATNLRNRLKQHLRDKHAGKWDKFSVYLVRRENHIKELESLILRIADPKGNATKGRLPRAENLEGSLRALVRAAHEEQISDLIGGKKPRKPAQRKKCKNKKAVAGKKPPVLAPYITRRFPVKRKYKGEVYKARVRSNGQINYAGEIYNSPSLAAAAVTGRPTSGWSFWRFRNADGEWVALNKLRKKR